MRSIVRTTRYIFIDLDLPYIIEERAKRIKSLPAGRVVTNILEKIKLVEPDIEMACKQQKFFKDLFVNCNKPIFIIEGLIYFLSNECEDWITNEILTYTKATVIFDYWPANGTEESICFKRVIESLKEFIPETNKIFCDRENISQFSKHFLICNDYSLMSIENKASLEINEIPQFTNQDEFFPVYFFVDEK